MIRQRSHMQQKQTSLIRWNNWINWREFPIRQSNKRTGKENFLLYFFNLESINYKEIYKPILEVWSNNLRTHWCLRDLHITHMILEISLLTNKPLPMLWANRVFPAPSGPSKIIESPICKLVANFSPNCCICPSAEISTNWIGFTCKRVMGAYPFRGKRPLRQLFSLCD